MDPPQGTNRSRRHGDMDRAFGPDSSLTFRQEQPHLKPTLVHIGQKLVRKRKTRSISDHCINPTKWANRCHAYRVMVSIHPFLNLLWRELGLAIEAAASYAGADRPSMPN